MSKEQKTVCLNCGTASLDNGTLTKPCCPDPDHRGKEFFLKAYDEWKKSFDEISPDLYKILPMMPARQKNMMTYAISEVIKKLSSDFLFETFY